MLRRRPLPLIFALASVSSALVAGVARADEARPKAAWRQEKHIIEVGGSLGAFFPSADHGLYAVDVKDTPKTIKTGFDIGVRFAYLPLRFVGVEVEGGAVPTRIKLDSGDKGRRLTMFGVRAHLILQMPTQLALFVLAGGGILGVSSSEKALGNNVDGALHVGGGLKYYLTPKVVLRIDGRDVISPAFSRGTVGGYDWAHSGEFTFGASFVIGRKSTKMPR